MIKSTSSTPSRSVDRIMRRYDELDGPERKSFEDFVGFITAKDMPVKQARLLAERRLETYRRLQADENKACLRLQQKG